MGRSTSPTTPERLVLGTSWRGCDMTTEIAPISIKPLVRTPGPEPAYFLHQASAPGRALG
jgi:hypothetical protein